MYRSCGATCLLLLAAAATTYAAPEIHEYDDSLSHFKSRPDIKAPKYEVEVYNKSAISPGYWVLGPYETLNMADEVLDGWIGPAIYDSDGMLVWSGAPTFDNSNTEDFKLSNVAGEEMFTVMDQSHWHGVLMDRHYDIKRRIKVVGPGRFNSHEFNFVENGTRALVVYNKRQRASEEESALVGHNGRCIVGCNGIAEYDTTTWETTWEWSSCGNILLNESTLDKGNITTHCRRGWDYVHANSIDKTPEGDYLFSCRHADTIFKISAKTKKIIWRLGGKTSDFKMIDNLNFTRQHNIRFRGYNGTHTIVSLLDNAFGEDKQGASWPFSRGLYLALDEKSTPMTAQIIQQFDHPQGEGHHSNRRGNFQVLTNGNVLMGWSERGQMSEHLPDGTIVMRARFAPRWLGTYRSYKLEYTGWPSSRPDVVAETVDVNYDGGTKTKIYASWNGATEVSGWNFYKTNPLGHHEMSIGSVKKKGFETSLVYDGFAKYILAEAVHWNGTVLGRSTVFKTELKDDSTEAVEEEEEWQSSVTPLWWRIEHSPWFLGSACTVIALAILGAIFAGLRKVYLSWPKDWTLRRLKPRMRNPFDRRRRFTILTDKDAHVEEGLSSADSKAPLMERERDADGEKSRRDSGSSDEDGEEEGRERFVDEEL